MGYNLKWKKDIEYLIIDAGKYIIKSDSSIEPILILQTLGCHLIKLAKERDLPEIVKEIQKIMLTIQQITPMMLILKPYCYHEAFNNLVDFYTSILDRQQTIDKSQQAISAYLGKNKVNRLPVPIALSI